MNCFCLRDEISVLGAIWAIRLNHRLTVRVSQYTEIWWNRIIFSNVRRMEIHSNHEFQLESCCLLLQQFRISLVHRIYITSYKNKRNSNNNNNKEILGGGRVCLEVDINLEVFFVETKTKIVLKKCFFF